MPIKNIFLVIPLLFFSAHTQSEMKKNNGDWITITGVVSKAHSDYFIVKTKKKKIMVEMDDWDWYSEGYSILVGDDVIVHGRVDHDLLEQRKVEAHSVYVKGLNTYYFASAADEEDMKKKNIKFVSRPPMVYERESGIQFIGMVDKVQGDDLILLISRDKYRVDLSNIVTTSLNKNNINVGDQIVVYGHLEDYLLGTDLIVAKSVTLLDNYDMK